MNVLGLGALLGASMFIVLDLQALSKSVTLNGGNSTFGFKATSSVSDSYTASGTVAYKITPSSKATATLFNNSFDLFEGSDALEFRRDRKVRKICSFKVASVSVYYNDSTVASGTQNLAVSLVKDGPGFTKDFTVGLIPVTVTAKPSLSFGVKGTASATTTGCSLSAGVPYVDAAIKANGGVGNSKVASAGIEGSLSLLYSELKPEIAMTYSTKKISYGVNWNTKSLNGTLSAYAKATLPNPWKAPINVKYSYELCKWNGASLATIPVYNGSTTF
jgi:hypothetical protein